MDTLGTRCSRRASLNVFLEDFFSNVLVVFAGNGATLEMKKGKPQTSTKRKNAFLLKMHEIMNKSA